MRPYIFIAHKRDSADYCRGCLMQSYASDFVYEYALNKEELITTWADYLAKNKKLQCNEAGYDFYIWKHGIQIYKETWEYVDNISVLDDKTVDFNFNQLEDEKGKLVVETLEIMKLAELKAQEIAQNEIRKLKEEYDKKFIKEAEESKKRRFLEYEKLKKEFDE